MINDTGVVLDALSAVMRLEEMRAQVAARNIAMANVPGHRAERFEATLQYDRLRAAVGDASRLAGVAQDLSALSRAAVVRPDDGALAPSLDAHVLELSNASARYQALGEGVSRQLALMRLAIGGGR